MLIYAAVYTAYVQARVSAASQGCNSDLKSIFCNNTRVNTRLMANKHYYLTTVLQFTTHLRVLTLFCHFNYQTFIILSLFCHYLSFDCIASKVFSFIAVYWFRFEKRYTNTFFFKISNFISCGNIPCLGWDRHLTVKIISACLDQAQRK